MIQAALATMQEQNKMQLANHKIQSQHIDQGNMQL